MDIDALVTRMVEAVNDAISKAETALLARVAAVEQKFAALQLLPGPKGDKGDTGPKGDSVKGDKGDTGPKGDSVKGDAGKDADPTLIKMLVDAAAAALPKAKDGLPGERGPKGDTVKGDKGDTGPAGKDADPLMIKRAAEEAVAALPKAKDGAAGARGDKGDTGSAGKDADPLMIKRMVEEAVAALPKAKDGARGDKGDAGKDADPALVRQLVEEVVAKLPKAKDGAPGKDVDYAQVRAFIDEAVAKLPKAKDGAQGPKGDSVKGDTGPKGDKGDTGPKGDAPDQSLLKQLIDAAVAALSLPTLVKQLVDAAFAALPKPKDGAQGPKGDSVKGDKGDTGPKGDSADPSLLKQWIDAAVAALPKAKDGAAGPKGDTIKGDKGEQGEPGRDAADLEPLLSIDETKSYRRGTWASHRNGLIRAARQTDPVKNNDLATAGWVVITEGIAAIVVTQDEENGRTFSVASMLTSGAKAISSFTLPVIMYRGVWREGGEHDRGDVCTWGGSAWHCEQKTKDKPGTSATWKLMVKEGQRGKDGDRPAGEKPIVRVK